MPGGVGFTDIDGLLILIYMISMFLVGFVPGFYLSYLFFTRIFKKIKSYFIVYNFISGIIFSYFCSNTIYSYYDNHNIYWNFFTNALPYIVLGEILIVAMHFFFFEKRKKKK